MNPTVCFRHPSLTRTQCLDCKISHLYLLLKGIRQNLLIYILSERTKGANHDNSIATISRLLLAELQRVKVPQNGGKIVTSECCLSMSNDARYRYVAVTYGWQSCSMCYSIILMLYKCIKFLNIHNDSSSFYQIQAQSSTISS